MTTILLLPAVLSLLCGTAAGAFSKEHITAHLCAKTMASLLFCVTGLGAIFLVRGQPQAVGYGLRIEIPLILGLLGDVFLALDGFLESRYKLRIYALGMAAFLLGHLGYTAVFLSAAPIRLPLLALVPLLPLGILLSIRLHIIAPPPALMPLAAAYSIVIALMAVSTLNLLLRGDVRGPAAFAASLCFVFSDLCLSLHDYPARRPWHPKMLNMLIMIFYFLAQNLFAITVYLERVG